MFECCTKISKNGVDVASADMFGGSSDDGGTMYHPTGVGHVFMDLQSMIGLHSILEVSLLQELEMHIFTLLMELDFSVI